MHKYNVVANYTKSQTTQMKMRQFASPYQTQYNLIWDEKPQGVCSKLMINEQNKNRK